MGKVERRLREKEMRRQQIMQAAKKVFSEKGLATPTMEEIARESELALRTLYTYFRTKDEIFISVILELLSTFCRKLEELKKEEGLTCRQKIRGVFNLWYEDYCSEPMFALTTIHLQASKELLKLSGELYTDLKAMNAKSVKIISEIFEDGVREGVFRDCHPRAVAGLMWSVFSGLALYETSKKMVEPRKDHLESTLEFAVDTLLRGLEKESA